MKKPDGQIRPVTTEAEINILDLAADEQGHRKALRTLSRRLPAMVAQLLRAAGVAARHASATLKLEDDAVETTTVWAVSAGMLDEGKAIELSRRMGPAKLLVFGELRPPTAAGMTVIIRVLQRGDASQVLRFEKDFFEEEAADIAFRIALELGKLLEDGPAPLEALDADAVFGTADAEALLRFQEGLDALTAFEGGLVGGGKNLERAIELFIGALERDAGFQSARTGAVSALASGVEQPLGLELALELAHKLTAATDAADAILLQARLHRRRREPGQAKELLENALDKKTEGTQHLDPSLVTELAQVLTDLGQTEEAISWCRRALDESTTTEQETAARANILEELGLALAKAGRIDDASRELEGALALDSHRPRAWANLGRCLHLIGESEASIAAYEKSLELNPHAWEVMRNFAELLAETGKSDRAEDLLRQWSAKRPSDPMPALAIAELLTSQNRADDAETHLTETIEQMNDDARLHAMLGGVRTQMKNFEGAQESYREALRCSPDDPALLSNLAVVLSHLGSLSEAEKHARRAVELDPHDHVSHKVLEHIRGKN